jgi:hypothetical protein
MRRCPLAVAAPGDKEVAMFSGWARWRRRRRGSGFEFLIAESIGAIHPQYWDRLAEGSSVFFSRPYLAMLERNLPDNLRLHYAVLSRGGEPQAILVLQQLVLDAADLIAPEEPAPGLWSRLAGRLRFWVRRPLHQSRVLVLGNLLSYGQHGYVRRAGLEAADFWHGAAEAIYRIRRAEKLDGSADIQLVKDLEGESLAEASGLYDFGYREAETEPNMVLQIDPSWTSYGDYLASLSGKYRKNVQTRILAAFEQGSFRIERITDPGALAPRLHQLYLQVHSGAELRPFTLPESYWRELPAAFGDCLRLIGIFRGEQLLGFLCLLRDEGNSVFAYHIGYAREEGCEAPLYLRLLHAGVGEAIAMGGHRILLGRTALEAKAALGAKSERMAIYARHRHPLLNKLLRGLLSHVDHAEAPERNPFRKKVAG